MLLLLGMEGIAILMVVDIVICSLLITTSIWGVLLALMVFDLVLLTYVVWS